MEEDDDTAGGEVCESTDKDSDAGMRVAENSRMNKRRAKTNELEQEDQHQHQHTTECKTRLDETKKPVRTYEKGEIVVSMDGELLLVQETCVPDTSDSDSETEKSLGSIEEPDVLDCWEAETVEPVQTPSPQRDKETSFHHVQKYYRLQAKPAPPEVADDEDDEEEDEDEIEEEPVISSTVPGQDSQEYSRVPVEEAFEVYESCYTGSKPPPAAYLRPKDEDKSDGPVPCKAVCCNIQ